MSLSNIVPMFDICFEKYGTIIRAPIVTCQDKELQKAWDGSWIDWKGWWRNKLNRSTKKRFCHSLCYVWGCPIWILVAFISRTGASNCRQVVLQIAATGGGWPLQLQERLLQLLNTPCEVELVFSLIGWVKGWYMRCWWWWWWWLMVGDGWWLMVDGDGWCYWWSWLMVDGWWWWRRRRRPRRWRRWWWGEKLLVPCS